MSKLSAVVLTKNEEAYIAGCIESLRWADEVVVFDSGSTDRTVEIAGELGAVVIQHPFRDFASQRNAALQAVGSEWIFFVDADERIPPALAGEILQAVRDPEIDGWWLPTYNYLLGRLMLNAGLHPDYHLRLFRRGCASYDSNIKVHEKPTLEGKTGYLQNPLIHYSCENWGEFRNHQGIYAGYKAQAMYEQGTRTNFFHFVAGPFLEFIRRYFRLRGYKDGWNGLILSLTFSFYVLVMHLRLWRLWRGIQTRELNRGQIG